MTRIVLVLLCAALCAACIPLANFPGGDVENNGSSISSTETVTPGVTAAPSIEAPAEEQNNCAEVRWAEVLNLRQGPGVENPVIAWMVEGEQVEILQGGAADWWRVRFGDVEGWARSKYLALVECQEVNQ